MCQCPIYWTLVVPPRLSRVGSLCLCLCYIV